MSALDIDGVYYCSRCMRALEAEGACPHCGYDPKLEKRPLNVLEEGTFLNGRYQLGARIATGGFGITYAAWDEILGMPMVIKEYYLDGCVERNTDDSDEVRVREDCRTEYLLGLRRFLRESRVLAMLQEIPGIVRVYDSFEANSTAYIAMEYVHGMTLDAYVKRERPAPRRLFAMLRQTVDALVLAHQQGVLHRDITPKNLLVQADGTIKLIDFGSAAERDRENRSILVTRHYAPIEQYDSALRQGPWTDVYGLCATIYEALTLEPPPDSLRRNARDELVPPERRGVRLKRRERRALKGGLEIAPERRIRSMEEFRSILYNLPLPEEVRLRRRFARRALLSAAAVAALMGLAMANLVCGLPLGGGLRYSLLPDGFHVRGAWGARTELAIPGARAGIPVTKIDSGALDGSAVRSVVIPSSVREVGAQAFHACPELAQVTLSEGVERVDAYAFAGCAKLHTVNVPSSLTALDETAFEDCAKGLMFWGARGCAVEEILRRRADAAASAIERTDAQAECDARGVSDGAFEEADLKNWGYPFAAPGEFSYERTEEGVTVTAYRGDQRNLVFPSYIDGVPVTAIAADDPGDVFPMALRSVTLPEHLAELSDSMLCDRPYLSRIEFGGDLRRIGDKALAGGSFDAIRLPEGLVEIGDSAFARSRLESVNLPESLRAIGTGAFYKTRLRAVALPRGVRELGGSVFEGCDRLESADIDCAYDLRVPSGMFMDCGALESVRLAGAIDSIGQDAFSGCASLDFLALPEGVRWIEPHAFDGCCGLRVLELRSPEVEEVDESAFEGCSAELVLRGGAQSVAPELARRFGFHCEDADAGELSLSVRADGGLVVEKPGADGPAADACALPSAIVNRAGESEPVRAIASAKDLNARRVELPAGLRRIDDGAFAAMPVIEEVRARSLEEIGRNAFYGCTDLRLVELPAGLASIGAAAFANCGQLSDVALPETLRRLGAGAFANCANLTRIELPGGLTLLPDGCFSGTGLRALRVPGGVSLCGMAFRDCKELQRAVFEPGVRTLRGSFYGCESLREVVLPDTLARLSQSTFRGCGALRDVWIYSMDADLDYAEPMEFVHYPPADESGVPDAQSDYQEFGSISEGEHLFMDCPEVTIHAHPGSTAEAYAAAHGLRFEPIPES